MSQRTRKSLLALFICVAFCVASIRPAPIAAATAYDWKQLGYDAQHSGHTPEDIQPPFTNVWNIDFANDLGSPERLYPNVQPVTWIDRAFIGTEHGNLYAIDLATGTRLWKFPAGADAHIGALVSTAGVEDGKVFVASMDGFVYAVDTQTGSLVWKFASNQRFGFSASVVLADGNVYAANRGGAVFAISQATGQLVWQKQLDAQVFMTPAYNNKKIYVAAMDMVLYALDAGSGAIVWQTQPGDIDGHAQTVFWPVVQAQRGVIILRPMHKNLDASVPYYKTYTFAEATGKPITYPTEIPATFFNVGPLPAGALDKDGKLITGWGAMWVGNGPNGFLLYDLNSGAEQQLFSGTWAGDENMIPSSAGDILFFWHPGGMGGYMPAGYYEPATGSLTYFDFGSLSTNFTGNLQSGGVSQGIVSHGYVLFVASNHLRALKPG